MRTTLITAVPLLTLACPSNKGQGGGGGRATGGAGGGSAGGVGGFGGNGLPDYHPECANSADTMSETSLAAARQGLADAGDGHTDVALSDQGCYRLERTRTAGEITALRVYQYTGSFDAKLDGGGIDFIIGEKVYAQWAKDVTGALVGAFDVDQDGFNERVTTRRPTRSATGRCRPPAG